MKAAALPDRGVVKVVGEDSHRLLNGLLTTDIGTVQPGRPRFAALLTPQGKIVVDAIVAEAPARDGAGLFLDCPRPLAATLVERLNFYKLRAKAMIEDLSEMLVVLAAWPGERSTAYGLAYPDPRHPALGLRVMLPPHLVAEAAADLQAELVNESAYEAHRIALGVPSGGLDFAYGGAFPHESDMDDLHGIDFDKGCYVGQEVVSRMAHRGTARTRIVPIALAGLPPRPGTPVLAGEKQVGTMGSAAGKRGLAMLRLDRVTDALSDRIPLMAGGVEIGIVKPDWARFDFPGDPKS